MKFLPFNAIIIMIISSFYLHSMDNYGHSQYRKYNVGFHLGTSGLGVELSTPISNNFSIRANINAMVVDYSVKIIFNKYNGKIKLLSSGLFLDYFIPTKSGNKSFKISTGVYVNNNKFQSVNHLSESEKFYLNGQEYDSISRISLETSNNLLSPYLGIGWGNNTYKKGWGLTFNLGAFYHGALKIKLKDIAVNVSDTAIHNEIIEHHENNSNYTGQRDRAVCS